jgi:hypothetical protein
MRIRIVQIAFSRNDTSRSGAFTSGITRTKGDRALRNVDVNLPDVSCRFFGVEMGFTLKDSGSSDECTNGTRDELFYSEISIKGLHIRRIPFKSFDLFSVICCTPGLAYIDDSLGL